MPSEEPQTLTLPSVLVGSCTLFSRGILSRIMDSACGPVGRGLVVVRLTPLCRLVSYSSGRQTGGTHALIVSGVVNVS